MKYIKEYNEFSINQIKSGIEKSILNRDIELKTTIDSVINNIEKYKFRVGSVEEFLYGDSDFVSEAIPDKLIKYVEDNNLDIDISNLIEYNNKNKEFWKVYDSIMSLSSYSDDNGDELEKLYLKEDELRKYSDFINKEVLKVKKKILNKYPL